MRVTKRLLQNVVTNPETARYLRRATRDDEKVREQKLRFRSKT